MSNCDFCYFHAVEENRRQSEMYPERFDWWKQKEKQIGKTWDEDYSYQDIDNPDLSIQRLPLFAACHCTD